VGKPTAALAEALAVTIEACGTEFSAAAVQIMLADLADYPEQAVLVALQRTRREHKGRLVLAAIIERIDDGRPGVEVAWAMTPRDERDTAVLTTEILDALRIAQPLLTEGDEIAARMAFKEAYTKRVEIARANRLPVRWHVSIGWDAAGRVAPLAEAVRLGRITEAIAEKHVHGDNLRDMLALAGAPERPALAAPQNLAQLTQRLPPVSTPEPQPAPPRKRWGDAYTQGTDQPAAPESVHLENPA
jgi:hypothetical protein